MMLNLNEGNFINTGREQKIKCKFCKEERTLNELFKNTAPVEHAKEYMQKKEWLSGPWERAKKERAIVEEPCPIDGCGSD